LPMDGNWLDPFLVEVVAVGRPARFQQVHQMELRKDYRGAAELLTSMLQEQPEYRAYVALGAVLVTLGDFDRAEPALRAAIALVREEFRAYHQLSRLLLMRANNDARGNRQRARPEFEEAAACARKAIAHRPDHAMPHVVLGMALRQLGKREKALQAFRAAVEREPNLTDAHFYLGETLAEAGQLDEARVSLQRAAELSPDDPRPKTALAKLTKNQH